MFACSEATVRSHIVVVAANDPQHGLVPAAQPTALPALIAGDAGA